ncbi:hypothetical protein JW935_15165 [candidate division KSB1 bacterium]|nr:hypothetical protein [candidate division KSB1 bacterium]
MTREREKMFSKAYQRFLDSMKIGFDQWHDGTGYDLETLGRLGPEERASIEELLIGNLKQAGDWRDVEALAGLVRTAHTFRTLSIKKNGFVRFEWGCTRSRQIQKLKFYAGMTRRCNVVLY